MSLDEFAAKANNPIATGNFAQLGVAPLRGVLGLRIHRRHGALGRGPQLMCGWSVSRGQQNSYLPW